MKIVDRKTFLSLPENTLYNTYEPCVFGPLEIKGESLSNDWFVQSLNTVNGRSSDDRDLVLDEAEESGVSFSFDLNCEGRDGCFENNQLFAVWEKEDVEALITRLQECIK